MITSNKLSMLQEHYYLTSNYAVTAPMSWEWQDALEKARTESTKLFASGGGVVNTDDYFMSQECREKNEKIKVLAKRKKEYKNYVVVMSKA